MNFLNPAFLFALAASAVPVIIHLLSRRKQREVRFSSLRFLEKSDRKSMRRINLRRLLLLMLRVFAIALVALAFARPVITGKSASLFPGREPKAVVVMVDRSYSMGAGGSGGTSYDEAVEAALDIADGLERDDELTIAFFDEGVEEVFSAERPGRAPAAGVLEGTAPSLKGTDLRHAFNSGMEILSRSRMRARELFVLSDFQRTSLSGNLGAAGEDETAARNHAPGTVRVFLVSVEAAAGPNVSVSRVILPGAAVHRGEAVRVRVFVRNNSREAPAAFPMRIDLGGARIIEKEIELPPGASSGETFEFDVDRTGWVRGEVSCREDMLPADDLRLFTLLVRDKTPVLLIAGREAFYLRQALLPEGADGDIDLKEKGWSGYTTSDLDGADVVVAGPGGMPGAGDIALLRRYAEDGGRLVVFISPGIEDHASALSSRDLTVTTRGGGEGFAELERPAAGHPLLGTFGEDDLDGLAGLRFTRRTTVGGLPRGEAVLSFSGGEPFLWVERAGDGAIVFVAVEPVPVTGDLVLSPYFLPLVQSMVLSPLGISPGREGALVGEDVTLPAEAGEGCTVLLPGGIEYDFTSGRSGPGSGGKASVPAGDRQGYIVARCGAAEWETAVNPDCRVEPDLDPMSPDEAADSLGIESYSAASAGAGMATKVREAREGREIADILIVLAAILLAAELAVAQAPGRGRGEEEQ